MKSACFKIPDAALRWLNFDWLKDFFFFEGGGGEARRPTLGNFLRNEKNAVRVANFWSIKFNFTQGDGVFYEKLHREYFTIK